MRCTIFLDLRFFLVAILAISPVVAEVELVPNAPERYTVRPGDTQWNIAARFLKDPWNWPEIWEANRAFGDPNALYPGDVLTLYYREGQPRIGLLNGGLRTVKLSPRVRVTPLDLPVPTIPIGAIAPFLSRPYVLDKPEIENAPYVVSLPERRVLGGTGDRLYVRRILEQVGGNYHIVRPGGPYVDPSSGNLLGYKALFVAEAVLERPGDPATLRITNMKLETGIGDRVLPASTEESLQTFYPRPGPSGRRGHIISVLNGVSQIGLHNVVVINLGTLQGIEKGHVFSIYSGGNQVQDRVAADASRWDWRNMKFWSQEFWYAEHRTDSWLLEDPDPNQPLPLHRSAEPISEDYLLPYEQAGELMVFRAFDQISFALIVRARRGINVLDTVRPPR